MTNQPTVQATIAQYKVSGLVTNQSGDPIPNQPVVAYDVDLIGAGYYAKLKDLAVIQRKGGMQLLGHDTVSGADGSFSITFTHEQFAAAEVGLADVVVYAYNNNEVIGRSALSVISDYVNGTELNGWNVVMDDPNAKGPSEYHQLISVVNPFMTLSKVTLEQIAGSSDQINFLSTELQQDLGHITILVRAAVLDTEINGNTLGQELLYGLGRQTISLDYQTLSTTSIAAIVAAITASIDANIIDALGTKDQAELLLRFATVLHTKAVQETLNAPVTATNQIRNILGIALPGNDTLAQQFYQLYINRTGSPADFWTSLKNNDTFKDKVPALLLTNQLSALTGNHAPTMQKLAPKAVNNDVTQLLQMSAQDWTTLIGQDIPDFITGSSAAEKQTNYANYMQTLLFSSFPNQKVSLMTKTQAEINIPDAGIRNSLNQFLTSTSFDLRTNRLSDNADPNSTDTFQTKLEAIAGDQKADVTTALNKIQRVFQFSPTPDVMTKLLIKGVDSAAAIARIPYGIFTTQYADVGDEPTLLAIHQRASHIVSMIQYTLLTLNRFSQGTAFPAIAGPANA
jgi:hypothetical protein